MKANPDKCHLLLSTNQNKLASNVNVANVVLFWKTPVLLIIKRSIQYGFSGFLKQFFVELSV